MENAVKIRNEEKADYRRVEEITRKAFWNLYVPGCNEHYLAHVMRSHSDFVPELDFVIEVDGQVIGNTCTQGKALDERGGRRFLFRPGLYFAGYQRMGYGRGFWSILEAARALARRDWNSAPGNYVSRGL